jgi:hypothetical protein
MLNYKPYCFHQERLLLGLFDCGLKHIAVLKDRDLTRIATTTPRQRNRALPLLSYEHKPSIGLVPSFQGSITCSRAEVNSLLAETYFNINENYILPKSCTLLLLRFTKEDETEQQDQISALQKAPAKNGPVQCKTGQPSEKRTNEMDFPIKSNGQIIEDRS